MLGPGWIIGESGRPRSGQASLVIVNQLSVPTILASALSRCLVFCLGLLLVVSKRCRLATAGDRVSLRGDNERGQCGMDSDMQGGKEPRGGA